MESKKHAKVDVDKKSALFMTIGLVISLSLTTNPAFEWKNSEVGDLMDLGILQDDFPDMVDIPSYRTTTTRTTTNQEL